MAIPDTNPANLNKIPQALRTGFVSRLRLDQTTLFISTTPVVRTNKRSSVAVSYAEIDEDYDDDDDYGRSGNLSGSHYSTNGGSAFNSLLPPQSAAPSTVQGTPFFLQGTVPPEKPELKQPVNPDNLAKIRHMLRYTDVQLNEIADRDEVLVPIRLNLEYSNFRISDFFLWNLNEKVLTPEMFAVALCHDLDLPIDHAALGSAPVHNSVTSSANSKLSSSLSTSYVNQIASTINSQIHEYTTFANVKLPEEVGFHVIINLSVNLNKQLYEDKFEWDLGNGTRSSSYIHDGSLSSSVGNTDELSNEDIGRSGSVSNNGNGMRTRSSSSTNLSIPSSRTRFGRRSKSGVGIGRGGNGVTIGNSLGGTISGTLSNGLGTPEDSVADFRDTIMDNDDKSGSGTADSKKPGDSDSKDGDQKTEADDYNGPGFTPLEFARTVVQDLGLCGEFYPAIAHALYESLYRIKKDALDGHLPPQEVENYAAFGKEAGWRVDQEMLGEEWAPSVEILSQEEIEKREIERERNIRRLKRESARMGSSNFDSFADGLSPGLRKRSRRGDSPAWH